MIKSVILILIGAGLVLAVQYINGWLDEWDEEEW